MTAAYAAFANHGEVPQPILIRRVEDKTGDVLEKTEAHATQAISDTTAFLMSSMMADVINAGTAARARSLGFTLPAGGKTGTTNDYNDAWFVGFTPSLVAGVWVGFDQPHTILPNGFAADVAVPLWASFMKVATRGAQPAWLSPPAGIVTADVCLMSGKLAVDGCEHADVIDDHGKLTRRSMVYTEYFARGTQPTTTCDIHTSHSIFGRLAASVTGMEKAPPIRADDPALAPATATSGTSQVAAAASTAPPEEPPKQKKRGFWSRVFGVGRDKGDDQRSQRDQKNKDHDR
jgi:penicillin-binding protein 1A